MGTGFERRTFRHGSEPEDAGGVAAGLEELLDQVAADLGSGLPVEEEGADAGFAQPMMERFGKGTERGTDRNLPAAPEKLGNEGENGGLLRIEVGPGGFRAMGSAEDFAERRSVRRKRGEAEITELHSDLAEARDGAAAGGKERRVMQMRSVNLGLGGAGLEPEMFDDLLWDGFAAVAFAPANNEGGEQQPEPMEVGDTRGRLGTAAGGVAGSDEEIAGKPGAALLGGWVRPEPGLVLGDPGSEPEDGGKPVFDGSASEQHPEPGRESADTAGKMGLARLEPGAFVGDYAIETAIGRERAEAGGQGRRAVAGVVVTESVKGGDEETRSSRGGGTVEAEAVDLAAMFEGGDVVAEFLPRFLTEMAMKMARDDEEDAVGLFEERPGDGLACFPGAGLSREDDAVAQRGPGNIFELEGFEFEFWHNGLVDTAARDMADLAITAANVKGGLNAQSKPGTSGAAIAAGDIVAKDGSGLIVPADANGVSPTDTPVGVALNSAPGVGQPVNYTDDAPNFEGFDATAAGTPYVLSATAGKAAPVADLATGMKGSLVGFGAAGNKMVVKIVASGQAVP